MPNMKFDRMEAGGPVKGAEHALGDLIPTGFPFIVFGSIRKEEENAVDHIIGAVRQKDTRAVIGLFPRHLQRLDRWKSRLMRRGVSWVLRSQANPPVAPGTVILWDTFSELTQAYNVARAAFVGGSLAPLGGQNFLEALACGVIPVIRHA